MLSVLFSTLVALVWLLLAGTNAAQQDWTMFVFSVLLFAFALFELDNDLNKLEVQV